MVCHHLVTLYLRTVHVVAGLFYHSKHYMNHIHQAIIDFIVYFLDFILHRFCLVSLGEELKNAASCITAKCRNGVCSTYEKKHYIRLHPCTCREWKCILSSSLEFHWTSSANMGFCLKEHILYSIDKLESLIKQMTEMSYKHLCALFRGWHDKSEPVFGLDVVFSENHFFLLSII